MTKMMERVIEEYANQFMWMKYYQHILDLDRDNLEDNDDEYYREQYRIHTNTMNALARVLSVQANKKYLPAARDKAMEEALKMYEMWLSKYYKTSATA